jgi:hypothetical protein
MNMEHLGWNRNEGEGRWSYYNRLMSNQDELETEDLAFCDLNPVGLMKLNT